jgi:hypothetical protein
MATITDAQRPINDLLIARLRAAGCVRGRFIVAGVAAQLSIAGERTDEKPMFFRKLNNQVFDQLEAGSTHRRP